MQRVQFVRRLSLAVGLLLCLGAMWGGTIWVAIAALVVYTLIVLFLSHEDE